MHNMQRRRQPISVICYVHSETMTCSAYLLYHCWLSRVVVYSVPFTFLVLCSARQTAYSSCFGECLRVCDEFFIYIHSCAHKYKRDRSKNGMNTTEKILPSKYWQWFDFLSSECTFAYTYRTYSCANMSVCHVHFIPARVQPICNPSPYLYWAYHTRYIVQFRLFARQRQKNRLEQCTKRANNNSLECHNENLCTCI